MVGWKRGKFGVQVNDRGVDPDSRSVRVADFHIHMNLLDRNSERGTVVDHRMLAKKNDLAGRGGFHEK